MCAPLAFQPVADHLRSNCSHLHSHSFFFGGGNRNPRLLLPEVGVVVVMVVVVTRGRKRKTQLKIAHRSAFRNIKTFLRKSWKVSGLLLPLTTRNSSRTASTTVLVQYNYISICRLSAGRVRGCGCGCVRAWVVICACACACARVRARLHRVGTVQHVWFLFVVIIAANFNPHLNSHPPKAQHFSFKQHLAS